MNVFIKRKLEEEEGELGCRSGNVSSNPERDVICSLSLLLVFRLLCFEHVGFYAGSLGFFFSLQKTGTSKFQFDQESEGNRFDSRKSLCFPH